MLISRRRRSTAASSLNDIQSLVSTLGGDARVPGIWDGRYGVTLLGGKLSTWDDARGPSGYGPQGTAVGTTKPTVTTGTITTDAVDNGISWPINSAFDVSLGRTLIYVGDHQASSGWPIALADNGLSKFTGFDDRTTLNIHESATALNAALPTSRGTSRRLTMLSRSITQPYGGGGLTEPASVQLVTQVHGAVGRGQKVVRDDQNALAASNWQMYVAQFAGAQQVANVRAIILLDHPVTGAEWGTIRDWAIAQHSIVADDQATRLVFFDGNSLMAGFKATANNDPPSLVMASTGLTTNCDYVQGGLPSVAGATMVQWVASRVAPIFKGNHAKKVYVCWELTNDIIGGSVTGAQAAANVQACCQAAKAAGATATIAITCLPRTSFSGAQETQRLAANTALRGLPSGIDICCDAASIANLTSASNTTYYDVDGTHLNDTGDATLCNDATNGLIAKVNAALLL